MPRNFSLSIRAQDEKAIVEFPLESTREDLEGTMSSIDKDDLEKYPGPKTNNQVIVHKQYQDNVNNRTLRSTKSYRVTNHDTVCDPVELEYDKDKGPPRPNRIETSLKK